MEGTSRKIAWATLVAGTLDILSSVAYTLIAGHSPAMMLKGLASAIPGNGATTGGVGVALVGLAQQLFSHVALVGIPIAWISWR